MAARDNKVEGIIMITVEELVQKIAEWITRNAESESAFLSPVRSFIVDPVQLLDYVSDTTGISREQIGEWSHAESIKMLEEESVQNKSASGGK
jgi:hypothetical protein